jgi:hypothetical protein
MNTDSVEEMNDEFILNEVTNKCPCGQPWWFMPVIPALRRLRQGDSKFEVSLGYTVRSCLKNQTKVPLLPL